MHLNTIWKGSGIILVILLLFPLPYVQGQSEEYTCYYRVYFRDKGANVPQNFTPSQLLSERAQLRRIKSGVGFPDYSDLPVFSEYIEQVTSLGFTWHCSSRWMNTALFKTRYAADTGPVLELPFVSEVKMVKNIPGKSLNSAKLDFETVSDNPVFDLPITMLNGSLLHSAGWDGSGVLIAVLDAGFAYSDLATSLEELRSRNGIKYTYNFVKKNSYVFGYHNHGTAVMSVLAGHIDGIIQGTAPEADFLLLITEDVSSEFPVEEDFWAAGAEFADSAGADIISSSLGYYIFDDPAMNYKFSDLDGNTTFITRAADIAASKGILVIASAGNERNKEWVRIIAPSDGDSVVSVGAVDGYKIISSFSSSGPSADGQIKPDVSALGVNITVQTSATVLAGSNGTSFSCPVISGMAACLLEAIPEATNMEIIDAMHASADRFNVPDSLYGYGIPDMVKALTIILLQAQDLIPSDLPVSFGPNPTTGEVEFIFRNPPGRIKVEVITSAGLTVYKKDFGEYAGRNLRVNALNNREQGLYFIRITVPAGTRTFKIIKMSN